MASSRSSDKGGSANVLMRLHIAFLSDSSNHLGYFPIPQILPVLLCAPLFPARARGANA